MNLKLFVVSNKQLNISKERCNSVKFLNKIQLWHKVTFGLVAGVIVGICFPSYVEYIKPIGVIFLRLISMVITPLIFCSLVSGITNIIDPSTLGRVGMKATLAFLTTTLFAILFGITIANVLQPGVGVVIQLDYNHEATAQKTFNILDFFVNIVPDNAIKAFAEGKLLQVVFFAIFTGIVINKLGSNVSGIKNTLQMLTKIVFKMISIIIVFSPYAAFSLTAWVVGTQGLGILFSLSKLVGAVVIAMALQYLVFGLLILVFCRISPIPFYRKSIPYQALAFSTSSSKATLPTTMQICKEQLGISDTSASFILPLGASINMDGFAINLGLTTVFFAQMLGITLSFHDYIVIIITATLGSIGGAGLPGASLIMLPMVLSSVNIPIEGVAIMAGIDRILDMLRTTINITGDATITLIIDHNEGQLDEAKYYSFDNNDK